MTKNIYKGINLRDIEGVVICDMCGGIMEPKVFERSHMKNCGYDMFVSQGSEAGKKHSRLEKGELYWGCPNCVRCICYYVLKLNRELFGGKRMII